MAFSVMSRPSLSWDRCCVLNFGTTNVDQARPFSTLFEKIAGTHTVYRPDDPTVGNTEAPAS